MAAGCPAPGADIGLVRGLLGTVDCNVRGLTTEGYAALARPDSTFGLLLTSLLTLYIAFIGYRLLVGRAPLRVGDLTVSAVKIGVVLALTTQWATYQTLVYDLLFNGPEQIARSLLTTVQPAGSIFRGDPFDGLQLAYDEMTRSAAAIGAAASPTASPLAGVSSGAISLGVSSLLLLLSTLGALLTAKVVLALLLALGPFFILLFLFDQTRGLFEGWLRAAVALALTPLAATLFLAVELTLLEPSLVQLHDMRVSGRFDLGPITSILILTLVFVAVAVAGALALGIIGLGLRLPGARLGRPASEPAGPITMAAAAGETAAPVWASRPDAALALQSRASAVAASAQALERRDAASGPDAAAIGASRRVAALPSRTDPTLDARPLGRSFPRRTAPGLAASAARRNR